MKKFIVFGVIAIMLVIKGYGETSTSEKYNNILISMVKIDNELDDLIINRNTQKLSEVEKMINDVKENLTNIVVKDKINKKNSEYLRFINLYSNKIDLKIKMLVKNASKTKNYRYSPRDSKTNINKGKNLLELNKENEELSKKSSELTKTSSNIKSLSKILYSINK
jgi:hypothetical protein